MVMGLSPLMVIGGFTWLLTSRFVELMELHAS